ncbi:MAG: AMP-dependent synthetase/ligase [Candidatus Hydrogenedentota bacterium]
MMNPAGFPRFEETNIPAIGYNCMAKVWDQPKLISKYRDGRHMDAWQHYTMAEQVAEQKLLARAWQLLGLEAEDRVAIMAPNRPRWIFSLYSLLTAHLVLVPVYPSLTPREAAYILKDSGARVLLADSLERAQQIQALRDELPALEHIFVMDALESPPPDPISTYTDLRDSARGHEDDDALIEAIQAATTETLAAIIYTSGTTGPPKGVMLTHGNFMSQRPVLDLFNLGPDDIFLNHLPFCHSFGLTTDLFGSVAVGATLAIADGFEPAQIRHALTTIRPTVLMSVPRLYEKIYLQVQQVVAERPGFVQRLFDGALSVGKQVFDLEGDGKPIPAGLRFKSRLSKRITGKIRRRAGIDRLRLAYAGGAPSSRELCHFYQALGIDLFQGYGLTETSPIAAVNRPGKNRLGTVGQAVAGAELRIAADGEVLIRGPLVMKGYYNLPEATAEAIDAEGWFYSGDVGEMDSEGFLRIVDRKKELIVTSGGKNIAPLPIESAFNTDPYIERVVLIGDCRNYLIALIVPDFTALARWAADQGLSDLSQEALAAHPEVRRLMAERVALVNANLARFEQIKRFAILAEPFSVQTGELTPTEKVKRRVIESKYAGVIDAVYAASRDA